MASLTGQTIESTYLTLLKLTTAALGADAVVLVRYGKSGMGLLTWGSMEGKGRAVKYISD